jgi:hypothetical protein
MQPETLQKTVVDLPLNGNDSLDSSVVSGIRLSDLRDDLVERARNLACSRNTDHAWSKFGPIDIMQDCGLIHLNPENGEYLVSMAALLMFGKDEAIRMALPGSRIETRAQVLDYQGYDDQETIHTNLLDSHARLMAFVRRNLPEGKRLPELPTVCMRDALFAEIVSNLLVHRDYGSQAWSRMTFQKDRITIENPCKSGRRGLLNLAWMQARPKNPLLCHFFTKINLSGEPGSGMKAIARWSREYFGIDAMVFDRENFKIFATSPAVSPSFLQNQRSMQVGGSSSLHMMATGKLRESQQSDSRADTMQVLESPRSHHLGESPVLHVNSGELRASQSGKHASRNDRHASHEGVQANQDSELAGLQVGHASLKGGGSGVSWPSKLAKNTPDPHPDARMREELTVSRAALHEQRIHRILTFCESPRNREEIQNHIGLNNRDYFRKEILIPLLQEGRLVATIPDKPNSPKQQYRIPTSG